MTKGQAARALANAIGEVVTVDVELRNLFQEVGLKWTDFEGAAGSRLFQAICIATREQVTLFVESPARRFPKASDTLHQLLQDFLSLPGVVWDERVAGDYDKTCPYPGMRSFTSPKGFYGREELTVRIQKEINANPLTLVTGASGSGKSSVVMAGVFPEWKHDYGEHSTLIIRPEGKPFEAIYVALCPVVGQEQAAPFRQPSEKAFSQLAQLLIAEGIEHPLIFIDPLEKIFAAESDAAKQLRNQFAAALAEFALHNTTAARVVLGMRDDFLGALSQFPELCRHTDAHLIRVFPMDADSLRTAVLRPAADHGVTLENEIVQDILNRVLDRPGMLPLMQDVLSQLWKAEEGKSLIQTRKLTAEEYFTLGGVMGSLTKRLDAICQQKGEATLRRIFLRTIRVTGDETTPAISRRGHRSELANPDLLILEELITGKVLVGYDPDPGQTEGTFGLPHEAVIQNWDKLRSWISDSRHVLTLVSRLAEDATERDRRLHDHPEQWDSIDAALLWRGGRLADLTKLEASDCEQLGFTEEMQGFLIASKQQELAEQSFELRRTRQKLFVATIAAVVAIVLLWIADSYRRHSAIELAESERRLDLTKLREAQLALQNNGLELVDQYLDDVKPEHRYIVIDGRADPCFAWHYLKRQRFGGLFSLYGHTGWVNSAVFSQDGQRIVSASSDRSARVWDARTGQSLVELRGHADWISSVAFSPDGHRIVSGSWDQTARVWDARTGQSLTELTGHTSYVSSVAFSPDGQRIISASYDQTARVWDALMGQSLFELKGHTSGITCVMFSPDSQRIVSGSYDRTARIWDASTGQTLVELAGHTEVVSSVAFSPDCRRIVSGSEDKTARVWDASTGKTLVVLKGHSEGVTSVTFSPDGQRIVSGSSDRNVRVWDASTGLSLVELTGHTGEVRSVAFSPDGHRIVSGSDDQAARIWDARTSQSLVELTGHMGVVNRVAFSPDGQRIVSGSYDRTARVWDASTGLSLIELTGHKSFVNSVSFSPDGQRIVSGSDDKTARVWDASTGQSLVELRGHSERIRSVAFSPNGQWIVSGSDDRTARVWDTSTGQSLIVLKSHTEGVTSVAFSPDGQRIASGSDDRTARVWDASTGLSLIELTGHESFVNSVSFSPDGQRIVSGSDDKTARVWDASTGQSLVELRGHSERIRSVAFSPNGQRIVSGSSDQTARVWDARTGQSLVELKGHTDWVNSVAFSPDGQRIVSGSSDQTARIWDARTSRSVVEIAGHAGRIRKTGFSRNGQRIFTSDFLSIPRVWDARTGALIPDATIPDTLEERRTSPYKLLVPRFNKVLVVPLIVSHEDQVERKVRTRPRPDLHRMEADRLLAMRSNTEAYRFAAEVQLALEQQALGQELVDAGKPQEAQAFFDKAKQLWPKPVPVEITPVTDPANSPPPPPEPSLLP